MKPHNAKNQSSSAVDFLANTDAIRQGFFDRLKPGSD